MLQELNAISDHLIKDGNDDLRQSIYSAFLEDAERGAEMILAFAKEKELPLDASSEDVVQAIRHLGEQINDDDLSDIELTPEQLALVSGGAPPLVMGVMGLLFWGGFWGVKGASLGWW